MEAQLYFALRGAQMDPRELYNACNHGQIEARGEDALAHDHAEEAH